MICMNRTISSGIKVCICRWGGKILPMYIMYRGQIIPMYSYSVMTDMILLMCKMTWFFSFFLKRMLLFRVRTKNFNKFNCNPLFASITLIGLVKREKLVMISMHFLMSSQYLFTTSGYARFARAPLDWIVELGEHWLAHVVFFYSARCLY